MSSIKKDINNLKKENKSLLKTINKAAAILSDNTGLPAVQQQSQLALMNNSIKQLQGNFDQIRILENIQSRWEQKNQGAIAKKKGSTQDLSQLTIPQVQNFKTNAIKRPPVSFRATASQRKKSGNRVRL
jgi:TolA-binding protein